MSAWQVEQIVPVGIGGWQSGATMVSSWSIAPILLLIIPVGLVEFALRGVLYAMVGDTP
jgi:hypothetical protein